MTFIFGENPTPFIEVVELSSVNRSLLEGHRRVCEAGDALKSGWTDTAPIVFGCLRELGAGDVSSSFIGRNGEVVDEGEDLIEFDEADVVAGGRVDEEESCCFNDVRPDVFTSKDEFWVAEELDHCWRWFDFEDGGILVFSRLHLEEDVSFEDFAVLFEKLDRDLEGESIPFCVETDEDVALCRFVDFVEDALTFSFGSVEMTDRGHLRFIQTVGSVVFQLLLVFEFAVAIIVDVLIRVHPRMLRNLREIGFKRNDIWTLVIPQVFLDDDWLVFRIEYVGELAPIDERVFCMFAHGRYRTVLGCIEKIFRRNEKVSLNQRLKRERNESEVYKKKF